MKQNQKISLNRLIRNDDTGIVYERHKSMRSVEVTSESNLQNHFGVFKQSDWIGKPFGLKIFSTKEIVPGCVVLEFGRGSWLLSTSLARAISPSDHLFTFDIHEQRASSTRVNFKRNGMDNIITISVKDIQGKGFPSEHEGCADAVFLDLCLQPVTA